MDPVSIFSDGTKVHCYVLGEHKVSVWADMTARDKDFRPLDMTWQAAFEAGLLAYSFTTDRIYCKEEDYV